MSNDNDGQPANMNDLYRHLAEDPKAKAAYEALHGEGSTAHVMNVLQGQISISEARERTHKKPIDIASLDAMSDEEYAQHRDDILKSVSSR